MLLRDREWCGQWTEQKENIDARLSSAGSAETSSAEAPRKSLEMLIRQPGNADRPGRSPAPRPRKSLSSMGGARPSPAMGSRPHAAKPCGGQRRNPLQVDRMARPQPIPLAAIAGNFSWAIRQLAALSVVRSTRQRAAASARSHACNVRTARIGSAAAIEMAGVTGSAFASTLGDRPCRHGFPAARSSNRRCWRQMVWGAWQC